MHASVTRLSGSCTRSVRNKLGVGYRQDTDCATELVEATKPSVPDLAKGRLKGSNNLEGTPWVDGSCLNAGVGGTFDEVVTGTTNHSSMANIRLQRASKSGG